MHDILRNDRLALHPAYLYRTTAAQWDDRQWKDEFQDAVYATAATMVAGRRFVVIDYGCGSGYKLIKHFREHDTVGYEIEPTLRYVREKYPARRWAHAEDFGGQPAELLICADVLEHMEAPDTALEFMAKQKIDKFVFSTPALELLVERGFSNRHGPPGHEPHMQEWTTGEFAKFIGKYFLVVQHLVINVDQCCQMIVAERDPRR